MTRWQALLLGLLLAGTAVAGEMPASPVKVDLDAVAASGKAEPVSGISTAGQPDATEFKVFADSGYVAVIDLRTAGEDRGLDEPAVVEDLGMEYVPLPIGRDDITFEKAADLERLLDHYDEPVLVHCGSANRVGALLALQHFAETGDREAALDVGRKAGLSSLESKVETVIDGE